MRTVSLMFCFLACVPADAELRRPPGPRLDADPPTDEVPVDDTDEPDLRGSHGFVGSPCETDADCPYDQGTCLTEASGYPGGMCSLPCTRACPDAEGHPTTFCVEASAPDLGGDGACHSRCDFGTFPESGCRTGYGCVIEERPDASAQTWACLPGEQTELSDCPAELAARGVPFELDVVPDRSPEGHPELTCSVTDPVRILGELHGVELRYADGSPTPRVLAGCEMALALSDTVQDVAEDGVVALYHYGTYSCRVIRGTRKLSRHGHGDAIDIVGFGFDDGELWTLEDHWEHDTASPRTSSGRWLYDAAYRWYDERYWNIVLTPNYNAGHDDHFHVDLTPGGAYIGATDGRWIGPAPYWD